MYNYIYSISFSEVILTVIPPPLERTTNQEGWWDNDSLPPGWKLSFSPLPLFSFLYIMVKN